MKTGGISERFGQIVTKYVVRSAISDDVETLDATRLTHNLGLSAESVSEVRKVMKGTAGKPSTTTMARYFKVLGVSDEDQNYVLGIGATSGMRFSELVEAIQASADFGQAQTNENQEIRDKKIRARLAMRDGDLGTANQLSREIEQYQSNLHFYARKDLEQSAENLAKTLAFRGSIAFQTLDFASAYALYSQIPKIAGLPGQTLEKFVPSIQVAYNTQIFEQKTYKEARNLFDDMVNDGVPPSRINYNTLMAKCEDIETGRTVAAEFKEHFPDVASRELSSAFIGLADSFESALDAATYLRSKGHFVGRKEYDRVFSFYIANIPAQKLLEIFFVQEFHFDTSLESPINQYRKSGQLEEALQLLLAGPHIPAAQKFYRQDYGLCRAYFEAELDAGNDEDNLHYAYGIAAALNGDWEPARRHLDVALERCFPEADKRRRHIQSLIEKIPPHSR